MSNTEIQFNNFHHQFYAVFVVNLIMFSHSCFIGWLSPVLPYLKSKETHLETGPLSVEEISWIGSGSSIGAFPGVLVFGWIISKIGVRKIMLYAPFYILTCWLLVTFAYSSLQIVVARILIGFGGAGLEQSLVLYVADIADDRIRGALGTIQLLSRSLGYLAAFICGAFVEYSIFPFIFIGLPAIAFVLFIFIPNTPQYLIRTGYIKEAKKSLEFYKNCKCDTTDGSMAIEEEMNRLKVAAEKFQMKETTSLKDFREPQVLTGLIIGIAAPIINQGTGCFAFMMYGVTIFEESGTHINAHLSAIILATLLVLGNLFSTWLVESLGRRFLMILSTAGCTIGLFTMAIYMYLHSIGIDLNGFTWIPVASLGFDIFISAVGIVPLTFVCVVEALPSKTRATGLVISLLSMNLFSFLSTKLFPILTDAIHLHGSMFIYGTICAFGTIFVTIAIKETTGINLDTIGEDKKEKDNNP